MTRVSVPDTLCFRCEYFRLTGLVCGEGILTLVKGPDGTSCESYKEASSQPQPRIFKSPCLSPMIPSRKVIER